MNTTTLHSVYGIAGAFGAGAGMSLYTIFIKQVVGLYPMSALMLAMFLAAAIGSVPGYVHHLYRQTRAGELEWQLSFPALILLLGFTISLLLGNYFIMQALQHAAPALVHVIHRVELIFTVIFAAWFLSERFNRWVLFAIPLVFVGVALMRWQQDTGASAIAWWVVLLIVGSAACFASAPVFSKRLIIRGYSPQTMNTVRLVGNCVILALLPGSVVYLLQLPTEAWLYAGLAGFFGPCLGRLCHTYALKFIYASSVSLVSMSAVVMTFILQYLFFALVPTANQIIGAVLVSAAVALTVISTYRRA